MKQPNLGDIVARVWEEVLRETEDPFLAIGGFCNIFENRTLYRTHLDRVKINAYGEVIPRIVTVRRNLRRLGNIRLDPSRLR